LIFFSFLYSQCQSGNIINNNIISNKCPDIIPMNVTENITKLFIELKNSTSKSTSICGMFSP